MTLLAHWIALSLLLLQQPTPGAQKTDREENGLRGNVRSILWEMSVLTEEDGRSVESSRFGQHVSRYDELGFLTEQVFYSGPAIHRREINSRDAQGNYVKKIYVAEWVKGPGPLKPDPGSPVPTVLTCSVKRDAQGNAIERICLPKEGKPADRTVYVFDRQKKTREITEYDGDSTPNSRCTEEYGSDGQEISSTCHYFSKPKPEVVRQTFTYEFDSGGN